MIYFDSAATTMQKPPEVARAAAHAMTHLASPGRGGHQPAMDAAKVVFDCRETAAELFHVENPENVILTFNATHGLNIAIRSLVKPGDTVLVSGYEHNAVYRTLMAMEGITVKVASSPPFCPAAMLHAFAQALTDEVRVVICNHISNVFGYVLPVAQIAALCHEKGVPFILDASQSAGCYPIHMEELGAAFIAMPGHKGLYGPQGTGLLLCGGPTVPLLAGGTGSDSASPDMPAFLPDRLEAGTHNVPGAAGLLAGMRFVRRKGEETILAHEQGLCAQAAQGLRRIPGVKVYAAPISEGQAGVLSFTVAGMGCEAVGEALGAAEIAVRAGLHCAPLAHKSAGTFLGGTVRASFSAFNNEREVLRFLQTVNHIVSQR